MENGVYTGNILSLTSVRNEQTRNTNRFSIKFDGLNRVIDNASKSKFASVKRRYDALKDALVNTKYLSNPKEGYAASLELSLLSVAWPKMEFERGDIHRFNDSQKVVNKFTPLAELQVTFYDYVNGSASALMYLWQGLVGDKTTGAIGYKQDYIADARLVTYSPIAPGVAENELESEILEEHQIVNIYPVDVDLGEHSYEGGEARKVTVLFACDNVFPRYYRAKPIGTNTTVE